MATYNFCTLFNSYYLPKGLSLYYSLKNTCSDFNLFIFAFDDNTYSYLRQLNLKSTTIISLNKFEDSDLLRIKSSRSIAEYCWTCTSSTIIYCLENFQIDNCTYLDADLCFYNSPKSIFKEIGNRSIALTKHNYHYLYDQSNSNGIYCVQFMYFKNKEIAINALKWWREKCIDWCYNYQDKGRYGDQGYLPELIEKFIDVHIIKNEGAGIAPWNSLKYKFIGNNKFIEKKTNQNSPIIFFHFHFLQYNIDENIIIANPGKVFFSSNVLKHLYLPYLKELYKIDYAFYNRYKSIPSNIELKIENYSILLKLTVILKIILKKNLYIRDTLLRIKNKTLKIK